VERGAGGCLNAVIGPEGLGAIARFDGLIWLVPRVRRGERNVGFGVPILGKDHMLEVVAELVDSRNDLIAPINGQSAAGAEVILQIDDKEDVGSGVELHVHSLA